MKTTITKANLILKSNKWLHWEACYQYLLLHTCPNELKCILAVLIDGVVLQNTLNSIKATLPEVRILRCFLFISFFSRINGILNRMYLYIRKLIKITAKLTRIVSELIFDRKIKKNCLKCFFILLRNYAS